MEHTYFFAVDLGATSGRTILGCLGEGKMELKELTRFPNHIIETGGHCYWANIFFLFSCSVAKFSILIPYRQVPLPGKPIQKLRCVS